jgi:hypothetical protein
MILLKVRKDLDSGFLMIPPLLRRQIPSLDLAAASFAV